jgi:hypothetical protein
MSTAKNHKKTTYELVRPNFHRDFHARIDRSGRPHYGSKNVIPPPAVRFTRHDVGSFLPRMSEVVCRMTEFYRRQPIHHAPEG